MAESGSSGAGEKEDRPCFWRLSRASPREFDKSRQTTNFQIIILPERLTSERDSIMGDSECLDKTAAILRGNQNTDCDFNFFEENPASKSVRPLRIRQPIPFLILRCLRDGMEKSHRQGCAQTNFLRKFALAWSSTDSSKI
ncbi:MAG: hypothetical protein AB7U82_13895 [Blastocatellales bacterium]